MIECRPVEFFPGTTEPVPALLTPPEAARLLRLDVLTRPDGTMERRHAADAMKSLDHLVRRGRLRPVRIGKSRCFTRAELLALFDGAPHKLNGDSSDAIGP